MARIFITREIQSDSPLQQLLSQGHELIGYSCVDFEAVDFQLESFTPWYFFYGKQGVRFFWQGLTTDQKTKVAFAKVGTIGTPTADYCRSLGLSVAFDGAAFPLESMSAAFACDLGEDRVTIARGTTSQRRIEAQLEPSQVIDLVVYHNKKSLDFLDPKADILIFTSPLNVDAYFDRFSIQIGQRLIAIGDSTKKRLSEHGLQSVIPEVSSEESIFQLLHQILMTT